MDIVFDPNPDLHRTVNAWVIFTKEELALIDARASAWLEANKLSSSTSPFAAMLWARVVNTQRGEMIYIDPHYNTSHPHLLIQVWNFLRRVTIESRQQRVLELFAKPIQGCLYDLRHFT